MGTLERGDLQCPQALLAPLASLPQPPAPVGPPYTRISQPEDLFLSNTFTETSSHWPPGPAGSPAPPPPPPRDPWVLLDFLAPWAFLGVLDIGDPQAPLYLKKSQATLERRAKEDCKGSPAPKAPWGQWGEPGCKGDFDEKSPLEPEGSGTSLATPRGTLSLLKGKRGGHTTSYRILAPRSRDKTN